MFQLICGKKATKNSECNKNVTFNLQAVPFFGDNMPNFLNLLLRMFEVGKFHGLLISIFLQ